MPRKTTRKNDKIPKTTQTFQCNTDFCCCNPSSTVRWTGETDIMLIHYLEKQLEGRTKPITPTESKKLKIQFAESFGFKPTPVNYHFGISLQKYLNNPHIDLGKRIWMNYHCNVRASNAIREATPFHGNLLVRNGKLVAFASHHEDVVSSCPANALDIIKKENVRKYGRISSKAPDVPKAEKMDTSGSFSSIVIKQEVAEHNQFSGYPRSSTPKCPETNDYTFLYFFHLFLLDLCGCNSMFRPLEQKIGELIVLREEKLKHKVLTFDAIQCYLTLSLIALKEQCYIEMEKNENVIAIDDDNFINLKVYLTKFKNLVMCCPSYVSRIGDLIQEVDMVIANGIRKNGRDFSSEALELDVEKVQGTFKILIDTFELY